MADPRDTSLKLDPKFDDNGLITAFCTDRATGDVLMLAHMDAEALAATIATGEAHFWSRSRARSGLSSGNECNLSSNASARGRGSSSSSASPCCGGTGVTEVLPRAAW